MHYIFGLVIIMSVRLLAIGLPRTIVAIAFANVVFVHIIQKGQRPRDLRVRVRVRVRVMVADSVRSKITFGLFLEPLVRPIPLRLSCKDRNTIAKRQRQRDKDKETKVEKQRQSDKDKEKTKSQRQRAKDKEPKTNRQRQTDKDKQTNPNGVPLFSYALHLERPIYPTPSSKDKCRSLALT